MKQEIHTLQAYSVFDKKSWLQEAEVIKNRYLTGLQQFEQNYFFSQAAKLIKMRDGNLVRRNDSFMSLHQPPPNRRDTFGSFFTKHNKKQAEVSSLFDSNEDIQNTQNENRTDRSPTAIVSPEELSSAKKKLNGGYIRRESHLSEGSKVSAEDLMTGKKKLRESSNSRHKSNIFIL